MSLGPNLPSLNIARFHLHMSQPKQSVPSEKFVSVKKSDLDRILELLSRLENRDAQGVRSAHGPDSRCASSV